jgi:hypothetical protein
MEVSEELDTATERSPDSLHERRRGGTQKLDEMSYLQPERGEFLKGLAQFSYAFHSLQTLLLHISQPH